MTRHAPANHIVVSEAPALSMPYGRDLLDMICPENPPEDPRAVRELNAALASIARNEGATPGQAYFHAPEKASIPASRVVGIRSK